MNTTKITNPLLTSELPHKYLPFLGIVWVSFLILSIFTASKTIDLFGYVFAVVIIAYPVTYIFNDIFTEVYGYRVSRRVVWSGFTAVFTVTTIAYLYTLIPPSSTMDIEQVKVFDTIFGQSWFIAILTIAGFTLGEFVNSVVLAKYKIHTQGKRQELRYIVSTFAGQIVDSVFIVVTLTYLLDLFHPSIMFELIISTVLVATLIEVIMLPITKRIVKFLKEKEGIDTYDVGTNFNPFKLG